MCGTYVSVPEPHYQMHEARPDSSSKRGSLLDMVFSCSSMCKSEKESRVVIVGNLPIRNHLNPKP